MKGGICEGVNDESDPFRGRLQGTVKQLCWLHFATGAFREDGPKFVIFFWRCIESNRPSLIKRGGNWKLCSAPNLGDLPPQSYIIKCCLFFIFMSKLDTRTCSNSKCRWLLLLLVWQVQLSLECSKLGQVIRNKWMNWVLCNFLNSHFEYRELLDGFYITSVLLSSCNWHSSGDCSLCILLNKMHKWKWFVQSFLFLCAF